MKHTPATPLPWVVLPYKNGGRDREKIAIDDAFELHACNAYRRLVEALSAARQVLFLQSGSIQLSYIVPQIDRLLRELGEL